MSTLQGDSVSLSWSVDLTADRLLKLGRGMLQLSLSDNVQPLAVWACEAYGAKIPMCLETRLKMERLAKPQYTALKQWGMLIGFTRQDTASELATANDVGVRFLGLAAALLSFGSTFQAAQALHVLLDESRPSRESLPTLQQLKDIFKVLEHKVSCAGFTDSLQGWDMLLKSNSSGVQHLFVDPDTSHDSQGNLLYNNPSDLFDITPASADVQQSLPASSTATDVLNTRRQTTSSLHEHQQPQPNHPADQMEMLEATNTLLPQMKPVMETRATMVLGAFREVDCPTASNIARLIQAMAEIDRIGEASSAVLRTSANMAAWCIAFIKWCLGKTPALRVVRQDGTCADLELFKPYSSKFMVEICGYGSKVFHVRTFYYVGKLEKLLWEDYSKKTQSQPWAGMVKVKVQFQHRLRNLQTRHDLFHVIDTLLLLARDLTDKFCITHDSLKAWTPRPFPESDRIIDIIADLYDIEKVISHVRGLEISQFASIWQRRKTHAIHVAELFLDILILSCFAVYDSVNLENLHVHTGEVEMETKAGIVTQIRAYLKDGVLPDRPIEVSLSQLHRGALSLAGAFQKCPDSSLPLISSKNGQVVYLSLLETMTLMPSCPLECRVYQGRLSYDGQYYDYATGEPSNLSGLLQMSSQPESTTTPVPIRDRTSNSRGGEQWFVSKEDNYLTFYLALDIGENFSLDPRSFVDACASTIVLSKCLQPCVLLEAVQDEIVYCGTIGTAVKSASPHMLRVITCVERPIDTLFVQAAMVEIDPDSWEFNGIARKHIVVTKTDGICLPCACRRALDILQAMFEGKDVGRAQAILIA